MQCEQGWDKLGDSRFFLTVERAIATPVPGKIPGVELDRPGWPRRIALLGAAAAVGGILLTGAIAVWKAAGGAVATTVAWTPLILGGLVRFAAIFVLVGLGAVRWALRRT